MNAISTLDDTVTAFPVNPRYTGSAGSQTVIVVPCYNEAERLNAAAFLDHLRSAPQVDFVFVDDGSHDATLDRLSDLELAAPGRVTVLSLRRNAGKSEAVRQGLLHAVQDAEFVGYWDADLATPLDAIDDFVRVLSKYPEAQVVYGARRRLLGHRIERTLARRTVSRLCALLARQAVQLPIGDTQCGAKLFRNSPDLRAAIAQPFSAGWLFDVELLTRLSAGLADPRLAFYEQPLAEWHEIAGSKVSSRAIVKSGFQMLRLIAAARFGFPSPTLNSEDRPIASRIGPARAETLPKAA